MLLYKTIKYCWNKKSNLHKYLIGQLNAHEEIGQTINIGYKKIDTLIIKKNLIRYRKKN